MVKGCYKVQCLFTIGVVNQERNNSIDERFSYQFLTVFSIDWSNIAIFAELPKLLREFYESFTLPLSSSGK